MKKIINKVVTSIPFGIFISWTSAVIVILAITICAGIIGKIESEYSKSGIVIEVSPEIVAIEDTAGNVWEYSNENDLLLGDKVKMKMFDNHTLNIIKDDEIISIEKE